MTGLESALSAQPVVKDVQTLKANLKEQEKRSRSENEAQDVVTITEPQPTLADEQRKRRKVSNPVDQSQEPETIVLDGPLPSTKEPTKPTPDPSTPSKKNLESPVARQKHSASAASNPSSPTKVAGATESPHVPKLVADAPATSQCEIKTGQPEDASNSVESPKKPAASDNESLINDQKNTVEAKETVAAASETKEPEAVPEPALTTEKATTP